MAAAIPAAVRTAGAPRTPLVIYHEKRLLVEAHKAALGCGACGERDPRCLDLHHTDPATKAVTRGNTCASSMGLERLRIELAKCQVLCANCHRKLGAHGRHIATKETFPC